VINLRRKADQHALAAELARYDQGLRDADAKHLQLHYANAQLRERIAALEALLADDEPAEAPTTTPPSVPPDDPEPPAAVPASPPTEPGGAAPTPAGSSSAGGTPPGMEVVS